MKRMSIKLRVTLWFTLLMVLLSCITLAFLFFAASRSALAAKRSLMTSMVEASAREIEWDDGKLDIDKDLESFRDGVYLSVYNTQGVPLYGFVPRDFDNSAVFADREMRAITGETKDWYLYDARLSIPGYGDVWVRGISEAAQIDSTIAAMLRLAVVVLPFFILLAAVNGYLITRRAFRPVRRITQTAKEIGEGNDLSRRIALGDGKDEIYTLAAEFDHMFARLEDAFETEKQFTSDASHELRTPTTVILSQCEYALAHAQPNEETKEALEAIQGQAQKMAALISQLLTLARTDRNHKKLTLEPVDLSELAEMVAEQQAELAEEKQISVQTDIESGIVLQGDETMLMRLLINLMENGVKYGREHGWLKVSLHREGDAVRGCVADNGVGIAPEHLEQIWKRFWQADPARSTQGAGLGLSMVKWIAEAHGGTVSVRSTPGEGSEFTFLLPCKQNKDEK